MPARRNVLLQHKRKDQEPQDDGNSDSTNNAERVSREMSASYDDADAHESKERIRFKRANEDGVSGLQDVFRVDPMDPSPKGSCKSHMEKLRAAWDDVVDILRIAQQKAELLKDNDLSKPEEREESPRLKQIFRALWVVLKAAFTLLVCC